MGDDESETVDVFRKSKLKPEKFEDARVVVESGDVEAVDEAGDEGEGGERAVLRRRSEVRGWREWKREVVILAVGIWCVED